MPSMQSVSTLLPEVCVLLFNVVLALFQDGDSLPCLGQVPRQLVLVGLSATDFVAKIIVGLLHSFLLKRLVMKTCFEMLEIN